MQIEEIPGGSSLMRHVMRLSFLALLGIGACIAVMALTVPLGFAARTAGFVMPVEVTLSGTVWQGKVAIGRHEAAWDTRLWDSIMALGWVADLRVRGPDTDLAGRWVVRPNGGTLAPLRGRMGWELLEAVMPGLEITCTTTADIDVTSAAISRDARAAAGQVRLAAGTCARTDGTVTDVPLPALVADIATTADGVGMTITGVDAPEVALGALLVTPDDRLRVTVFAVGAAMVPGLPRTGDSQIELPLALFTQ
jgi:hypothetical protein